MVADQIEQMFKSEDDSDRLLGLTFVINNAEHLEDPWFLGKLLQCVKMCSFTDFLTEEGKKEKYLGSSMKIMAITAKKDLMRKIENRIKELYTKHVYYERRRLQQSG